MTADKRSFARAVDALATKQTAIPERFNSNSQLTVNGSCPSSLIAGKGVERGWLCGRKADGINFGLTVSSRDPTHRFSIDVVEMQYVMAPNHVHPGGGKNSSCCTMKERNAAPKLRAGRSKSRALRTASL